MRTYGLILLLIFISLPAMAKDDSMQAIHAVDGVMFESLKGHGASAVSLRGPGGYVANLNFEAGQSPFIDVLNVNGMALADGLYKFEVFTSPLAREGLAGFGGKSVSIDRNAFSGITDPKKSPMSGSFRVMNGEILDPELAE